MLAFFLFRQHPDFEKSRFIDMKNWYIDKLHGVRAERVSVDLLENSEDRVD